MSTLTPREHLRQRADYTHKPNLKTGRHGWLRLTPAYSVKVVEEIIDQCDQPVRIFDPFCGTATTALSAAYHGHESVTTDINPFLIWLGKAKTAHYSPDSIAGARSACDRVVKLVKRGAVELASIPPIHKIERWWDDRSLSFLRSLRGAIDAVTEVESDVRTLLLVAFCRTLIGLSNAAFNHQSMSFKDEGQLPFDLDVDMGAIFADNVQFILMGAAYNPTGVVSVVLGDARNASAVVDGSFDRVITSPPYANRMSYIRELRPYMYWLGYLVNGRDAGEMDWLAIGGTWGAATSRLTEWQRPPDRFKSKLLDGALVGIAHDKNHSGQILSKYVAKYHDDMWSHFRNLTPLLSPDAEVHYIVGNSTFYGVLLSVEQLYAQMMRELGFVDVECRPIRKRNSKKELVEFDVTGRWPGRG